MRVIVIAVCLVCLFSAFPVCGGESWQEEQKLDKQAGILNRPWTINVAGAKTRGDLREAAQVRTGLPSYDQQPERAQQSPASLIEELTTPVPEAKPVSAPATPPADPGGGRTPPGGPGRP